MTQALLSDIEGTVLTPDDHRYDESRGVYNVLHAARPGVVVRPANTGGVVRAIEQAKLHDLEVAVKGGGHSLAGYSTTDGGMLIDLESLNEINIDADARSAVVGGGVRTGPLVEATHAHGLSLPLGDSPHVGVGGITLGGGIGWLSRKHGLTLDSLDGVEIVLADGHVLTVSDTQLPDLFWALRGGGGNFGIVTRFRYRLHPIQSVIAGALALPASPATLCGVLDIAADAPDELGTISLVTQLPPLSIVPEAAHGQPAILTTLVWCGDPAQGQRQVDRLRRLAPPIVDQIRMREYPEMYSLVPDVPETVTSITSTMMADRLDDHAIEAILDAVERPDSEELVLSAVELRILGGAIARVPSDATAFAHRHRQILCSVVAAGFEPSQAEYHRLWVRSLANQLSHLSKGAYLNFVDDIDEHHALDVYPGDTLHRLATIKARYDPDNVFHRNLNVRPTR